MSTDTLDESVEYESLLKEFESLSEQLDGILLKRCEVLKALNRCEEAAKLEARA